MENGIWRTVGGRRIFIKDGESLSSAMKKSGKFKNVKKELKSALNNKDEQYQRKLEEYIDDSTKKGGFSSREMEEIEKYYGKNEKEIREDIEKIRNEQAAKEKYMNIPEEERVKAYEEEKNWKDLVKEMEQTRKDISQGKTESVEKLKTENANRTPEDRSQANKINSKFKNAPADIQKNVSDFERVGLKVEKAFETDAFGTGKEDRFELSDGRYIAHSTESMGSKEDSWSINKVEGGDIKSQEFKSYDRMMEYLQADKQIRDKKSPNSAYSKAFNKYKKEHPNTKLNLSDFIKISEGGVGGSK